VIKTVALSILTKLTVEVCRAAGEGGIAAFVETVGTVLALVVALPLVRAVVVLMGSMLG
jgi:stage III sporulation protein AD